MFIRSRLVFAIVTAGVVGSLLLLGGAGHAAPTIARDTRVHRVTVPEADRFTPFALTVHAGDVVEWVNKDTDDHTVVSDDAVNTIHPRGIDQPLVGTVNNGGPPGTFRLRLNQPGTFVYYCRLHSHLDAFGQPVAPGPDGGIQDANGNFGTPMMGVITVLPND